MNKTVTEKRFGEYYEDDKSVTLRSSSASVGGGSEVLVISYIPTELEAFVEQTTNGSSSSK